MQCFLIAHRARLFAPVLRSHVHVHLPHMARLSATRSTAPLQPKSSLHVCFSTHPIRTFRHLSPQPDARVFRIRATINLLALIPVHGTHHQNKHNSPVQPQNFGEDKNQYHADEDARLAHERTHALLGLAMVLCYCFPSHIQRLLQCRWRSPQPDQTGQPTDRRPCAGSRHTASTSRAAA
jgi:hypothetical protein